ncbi:MAG: DUF6364 family protein [Bacteroidales bacterium]|nr:DUF6364 family protein [Bacteroidales bacterium]
MIDRAKEYAASQQRSHSRLIEAYLKALSENDKLRVVKEKIRKIKVIVETSDLNDKIIDKALSSKFSDFVDVLQYYFATETNCNILITIILKDFKESDMPVLTPDEYLQSLKINAI